MSQPLPPRVSFVVPAFNTPPSILQESLASVARQDFTNFECLIIDESTAADSIAACAAFCKFDPRFNRIVPGTRVGLAASLNLGIRQARGEYIARFDADDICLPGRLTRQVAVMDAQPQIGVLGGGLEIIDTDGQSLAFRDYPRDHGTIARHFHSTTPIAHPTVMIRRSIIAASDGYDPAFRFAEDLDLWLRLLNAGVQFANLPETLVRYRQSNTRRHPQHWQYNLRARRKNLAGHFSFRGIAGIGAISIWSRTPPRLQEAIFRFLLLRYRQQSGKA